MGDHTSYKELTKAERRAAALAALRPTRFCWRLPELEGDAGQFREQECLVWPKPADCRNCPDPGVRFQVAVDLWKKENPKGDYRVKGRRHDILVEFLDGTGQVRKEEQFPLVIEEFLGTKSVQRQFLKCWEPRSYIVSEVPEL